MRRLAGIVIVAALSWTSVLWAQTRNTAVASRQQLEELERAITQSPEDLLTASDYRQLIIASGGYDRSTKLFERLAKQKGSGPNVFISLALAYVDKVPVSGDIRRLYLGRDAMRALTRSIELRPGPLAFYVRGLINLFYNNFIFHRAPQGVADIHLALSHVTPETPPALAERVWYGLGDAYWRAQNVAKARETWIAGVARFPQCDELKRRVAASDEEAGEIVGRALNDSFRVDTRLKNLVVPSQP